MPCQEPMEGRGKATSSEGGSSLGLGVLRARYARALEELDSIWAHNHRSRELAALPPGKLAPSEELVASGGDLQRVASDDITPQDFSHQFSSARRPVMLLGAAQGWRALHRWSSQQELLKHYGDVPFKVTERDACGGCSRLELPLRLYVQHAEATMADSPFYVFERDLDGPRLALAEDFEPPAFFRDDLYNTTEYTRAFLPMYRYYVIGVERTGSNLHVDPCCTSAWNTLLCGLKRWVLFPPNTSDEYKARIGVRSRSMDTGEPVPAYWWLDTLPELKASGAAETLGMIECIQRPGETIFVPAGWWHAVLNIGFTAAVTQNLLSPSALEHAWPSLAAEWPDFAPRFARLLRVHRPDVALPEAALELTAGAGAEDLSCGAQALEPFVAAWLDVPLPRFGKPGALQREVELCETVQGLQSQGNAAVNVRRDQREAAQWYTEALALLDAAEAAGSAAGSLDAELRVERAKCQLELGLFEEAVCGCRAVLEEEPGRLRFASPKAQAKACRYLALALLALDRQEDARAALQHGLDSGWQLVRPLRVAPLESTQGGATAAGASDDEVDEAEAAPASHAHASPGPGPGCLQQNGRPGPREGYAAAGGKGKRKGGKGSGKSKAALTKVGIKQSLSRLLQELRPRRSQSLVPDLLQLVATGCREQRTEDVRAFLLTGACRTDARCTDGSNALRVALDLGNAGMVKALLEQRAAAHQRFRHLATPLMLAAQGSHCAVMEALLEHRADVHAEDLHGRTALLVACAGEGPADLEGKTGTASADVVELLLQWRADANHQAHDGQAPLHLAGMSNNWPLASQLLCAGACFGRYYHSLGYAVCSMAQRGARNSEAVRQLRQRAQGTEAWTREAASLRAESWWRLLEEHLRPVLQAHARDLTESSAFKALVESLYEVCSLEEVQPAEARISGANPLLELHGEFVQRRMPGACKQLWSDPGKVSEDEAMEIMVATGRRPLAKHASGAVGANHEAFHELLFKPLTRSFSCAVPDDAALACVARHAPVVEMGAGSGYWAALLEACGCDVVAYDAKPPTLGECVNELFHSAFTEVRFGEPTDLAKHGDRALLLVWPLLAMEYPVDEAESPWDEVCLEHYAGSTVIYVGEWAGRGAFRGASQTASVAFQRRLQAEFECIERLSLPHWPWVLDDLSVWRRRSC